MHRLQVVGNAGLNAGRSVKMSLNICLQYCLVTEPLLINGMLKLSTLNGKRVLVLNIPRPNYQNNARIYGTL